MHFIVGKHQSRSIYWIFNYQRITFMNEIKKVQLKISVLCAHDIVSVMKMSETVSKSTLS